jgi:rfaE bifunctional protein nucleotidyltransferase chain/domain
MVLSQLQSRYRQLAKLTEKEIRQLDSIAEGITHSLKSGKKLYVFGCGASLPLAQYLAAEIGTFFDKHQQPNSVSIMNSNLKTFFCISTESANHNLVSKQIGQVVQLGDFALCLAITGNSKVILRELEAAKRQGGATALIAGSEIKKDQELADFYVEFGGTERAIVREAQLMLINILIEMIEVNMGFKEINLIKSESLIFLDYEFDVSSIHEWNTIVWVNGCFDILHEGHLLLLQSASRLGTHTIVGINSDESVRRLKGDRRPIISEVNRARTLSKLPYVDAVIIFSDDNPLEILQKIQPKIVVKGAIYQNQEFPEKEFLHSIGCEIIYTDHLAGLSTSNIIENSSI